MRRRGQLLLAYFVGVPRLLPSALLPQPRPPASSICLGVAGVLVAPQPEPVPASVPVVIGPSAVPDFQVGVRYPGPPESMQDTHKHTSCCLAGFPNS